MWGFSTMEYQASTVHVYTCVCNPVIKQAASDTASFADNTETHPNCAARSVPLRMGFSCQIQLVKPIMIHIIRIILGKKIHVYGACKCACRGSPGR